MEFIEKQLPVLVRQTFPFQQAFGFIENGKLACKIDISKKQLMVESMCYIAVIELIIDLVWREVLMNNSSIISIADITSKNVEKCIGKSRFIILNIIIIVIVIIVIIVIIIIIIIIIVLINLFSVSCF